jgi:hypothetical protein
MSTFRAHSSFRWTSLEDQLPVKSDYRLSLIAGAAPVHFAKWRGSWPPSLPSSASPDPDNPTTLSPLLFRIEPPGGGSCPRPPKTIWNLDHQLERAVPEPGSPQ